MDDLIFAFEFRDEIACILLLRVIYAKIIHHEREMYVLVLVRIEDLGDLHWCIPIRLDM